MLLSKSIFRIAIPRNVQYGQNGVRGRPVRQIVEVEKQIGRGSVCCQMDHEALAFFALERQRRNQNVMKTNARVGKICKVVIMPMHDKYNIFLSESMI